MPVLCQHVDSRRRLLPISNFDICHVEGLNCVFVKEFSWYFSERSYWLNPCPYCQTLVLIKGVRARV